MGFGEFLLEYQDKCPEPDHTAWVSYKNKTVKSMFCELATLVNSGSFSFSL